MVAKQAIRERERERERLETLLPKKFVTPTRPSIRTLIFMYEMTVKIKIYNFFLSKKFTYYLKNFILGKIIFLITFPVPVHLTLTPFQAKQCPPPPSPLLLITLPLLPPCCRPPHPDSSCFFSVFLLLFPLAYSLILSL